MVWPVGLNGVVEGQEKIKTWQLGNKKLINSFNTDGPDYPGRNSDDFATINHMSNNEHDTHNKNAHKHVESLEFRFLVVG